MQVTWTDLCLQKAFRRQAACAVTSFSRAEVRAPGFVPVPAYLCYTLQPRVWASTCIFPHIWILPVLVERSYKQTTFLSPVCTDNLGISSPLHSPSGCVNITGVVEGRIALTSLPHPVHCVLPSPAQPHKDIPLGCESDLLGGFNHLPLLDFSTFTATKHASPRVQSDLKTFPSRDFQKLEPRRC